MANHKPAAIPLALALLALLSASLHIQAQGVREGDAGDARAAEYVVLEPKPEQVVVVPAASAKASSASNLVCGHCKRCLNGSEPCLTTCCYKRICAGSICKLQWASCGCDSCDAVTGLMGNNDRLKY